jgi:hypothetical protein
MSSTGNAKQLLKWGFAHSLALEVKAHVNMVGDLDKRDTFVHPAEPNAAEVLKIVTSNILP